VVCAIGCKTKAPNSAEGEIAQKTKEVTIGGKEWINPTPDNTESQRRGGEHFRHHCQFCHRLDGQNTGVPFADRMSPVVADLASPPVQAYRDGQLKWIIENGIRFSAMPAWKDILSDEEMWYIVRYPPLAAERNPGSTEDIPGERARA
jgi:mono/diheme cytochrome c family protein